MKVIFLDIDGVVVTEKSLSSGVLTDGMADLDPVAAALVKSLCQGDELVRIVISSTWRFYHSVSKLSGHLERFGLPGEFIHEDWKTIEIDPGCRGDEIAEWLSRHPEVDGFVILDDDSDFLPGQMNHHVATTFDEGFTDRHKEDALRILAAG